MKRFNLLSILCAGAIALLMTSCKNQDVEFPDYGRTTVYFAYQYPVRTIVLGDDTYDTSLDNAHQCQIYATMGGVYANKKKIDIDFVVDNSLCDKLTFGDGSVVKAMPSNYYTLAGSKISLDHAIQGAVGVQLTDAFFADPLALQNTYVIPLRMTKVTNADSILSGVPKIANAPRGNSALWDIAPKDYVLYCLKYINPYHANYLRRGKDVITIGSTTTSIVRHKQYVENDEVCSMTTKSLSMVEYPVTVVDASGANVVCKLLLTFDNQGKCSVSTTSLGFSASGTGSFVKNGEKNSWGNKDRNAIYLNYNITMGASGKTYQTNDTLVVRDRGVKMETFTPAYTN
ncbi:DUF5627 domain-containing protein [Paludibacter sp.]|uniref:DUF5627 domain-containing protein n=1 Tax=Paludibacter sp. TaxID=1898105 RepID=UPI00135364D4|nr:DUF5627 domain-containing protein [Paludibacter sp.]MTK54498.1 DUF1735 domain-containing protein [Paludibacter sp.]